MKQQLFNLGQWVFKHRWRVITAWLVLLVVTGILAATYIKPLSSTLSIPGVDAQVTMEQFNKLFSDTGISSGRIVLEAKNNTTLGDHQDKVDEIKHQAATLPEVTDVQYDAAHTVSEDGRIGFINVQLSSSTSGPSPEVVEGAKRIADQARSDSLNVEIGGDLNSDNPGNIIGVGEVVGVAIAVTILLATFGSIVAAGMPVLAALATVGVSMASLFSLSNLLDINTTTPALAVMLGLAVGIDYSLFIINRYRAFRRDNEKPIDAIGHTVSSAGSAVVFAAGTVVIALSALAVVDIPFMTTMGLTAAATVALAAIVAITLVPALISLAGERIFNPSQRKAVANGTQKRSRDPSSLWYRWGTLLLRFRLPILLVSLSVIGIVAWPATDLSMGLPTDETASRSSSRYRAAELLREGFGAGYNGPLLVLAEGLPAVTNDDRVAVREVIEAEFESRVAAERDAMQKQFAAEMATATSPDELNAIQERIAAAEAIGLKQIASSKAQLDQQVEQFATLRQGSMVADRITELDGVQTAQVFLANSTGSVAAIQVVPTTGPSDEQTADLVTRLRDSSVQSNLFSSTGKLSVTGTTAMRSDINQRLSAAMPVYLAVVIGLSLILLLLAFRSIIIPIKATLGFLLSLAAMLGALVAVFQWGLLDITDAPGPIISFLPIIGIGILFGLAMDYEFFLVSSMHETYSKTKNANQAIIEGFAVGSRVVLAAGLIMVSVFAGFVASHDSTIQSLGFALAIGILVDAFIVRMTIVPIVMSYIGDKAWWLPNWINKRLPKVTID